MSLVVDTRNSPRYESVRMRQRLEGLEEADDMILTRCFLLLLFVCGSFLVSG